MLIPDSAICGRFEAIKLTNSVISSGSCATKSGMADINPLVKLFSITVPCSRISGNFPEIKLINSVII